MQRCSNCGSIASPARTPAVATGATPRDCWPMLAVRRKIVVRVGGKSPQASLRPHPGLPRRERIALGGVADSHHAIVQGLKKQLPPVAGPQRENASARRDLPSSARARERPHVHFIGPRLIRLIRQPTPVWGKRRVELGERRSQEQLRFPEPDSRAAPSRIAFDRRGENVIAAAVSGRAKRQALSVRRKRIRHLGELAVGQTLRLARPSERIQYKPGAAGLVDWNTMFFRSGVHTGH